ncbi:hypothetical protein XylorDRAFT_0021 [Xylanibacter oryzae DSM 17970]|uniref:Uncharacterized protein n=1 Tax=Xylanibacter oryzae DSM 17970 TaxID=915438 RepID=A0ABN0RTX7_9BACT|nr:hypothetical protein [Xylanibacter oryzae]EXG77681.1 hypothetical protein XylorDRAFT_0021 [Xylanibacter oryzae DSM 17970]
MKFKESQYLHQAQCAKEHPEYFENDLLGGVFRKKKQPFALQKDKGERNLFESIRIDTLTYFKENGISWWNGTSPTNHMLSSQIACLNHLFAIRHDYDAAKAIAETISGFEFDSILKVPDDKGKLGYIAFEEVSGIHNFLNEGKPSRGSNCTSIDALLFAEKDNEKWIIPIEWKYVEQYSTFDKSKGNPGKVRVSRYAELINQSEYLKTLSPIEGSIYFQEPFYQLMRQTLWAENEIKRGDVRFSGAKHFIHAHVVPNENKELLQRNYRVSGLKMEDTWRACLKKDVYRLITPKDLFKSICNNPVLSKRYNNLIEYLNNRY